LDWKPFGTIIQSHLIGELEAGDKVQ
jgi:hypothetical protein